MRREFAVAGLWLALLVASRVFAGEADVLAVKISPEPEGTWRFDVTVHHDDEGWEHYADGWEVLGPDGKVLGKRTLFHPHLKEKDNTFTRWQPHIEVPPDVTEVTVRAHDKVHGYGGKEVVVQMPKRAAAESRPSPAPEVSPKPS